MLWIDRVELLAIGEDLVTRHRDRLGRNGALHDVANSFDMLVEIRLACGANRAWVGVAYAIAPQLFASSISIRSAVSKNFTAVIMTCCHSWQYASTKAARYAK